MPRTGLTVEEIRDKAVAAAVAHMRRHGFEKVRLVDIARDVGVSHAALYAHFADKTALLDSVSERWLGEIDGMLETVCRKEKDPLERIHEYFLRLHQVKLEKVLHDPELYRAFDMASENRKPFVVEHLKTMNRQLAGLVKEAIAAKRLRKEPPERHVSVLLEAAVGFVHPRLVAEHAQEKREALLRRTLEAVLAGLG